MICYNPTINEATNILVPLKRATTFLLMILVSGCNYPSTPPPPTVDMVATAVAGTLAAEGLPIEVTAVPTPQDLLPRTVYFLSRTSGSEQIWRLERDGVAQTQVTDESTQVSSYDVSRVDGSVAYVSSNQLYLVNADGSNRRLLVDNAAADPEAAHYFYRQRISDPLFSADGRYLAYAFDGVWILDLSTNQAVHLVTNQLEETENGAISPEAFYAPLAWAPNSGQLLLSVGGLESSTLAFLDPGADPVIEVESSGGIVCCHVAWAPDSKTVLVGSPYIGLIEPGLWRYDAATGERIELLGLNDEGLFQYAGWPLQLADGSLRYFYTSSTEIPAGDLPLFMMRSDGDGVTNRLELRPDSFSNIGEVLWAEDGAFGLILQLNPSGGTSGSVVLALSDGRQLQILLTDARGLRWGP